MFYRICPYCDAHLDPGERCDCQDKEREAAPQQRERPQAKTPTVSLAEPPLKVKRYRRYGMSEELRELRITKQIPAKDMVAVVQALYPKYDKTVQSKCENGEAYGVTIRPDAMHALYKRFAPEHLEPPKRTRHGQHRLTCRISCRLENEDYEALQQLIEASGCATVQDWLTGIVRKLIAEGVTPGDE